jgi:hypothetical protein
MTNFVKRCTARNLAVQVRGPEVSNESTKKSKLPDFISTLEPIAEGAIKASQSEVRRFDDRRISGHVNNDTDMMLHGAETFTRDTDVESIDYEKTIPTDVVLNICLDKADSANNDADDNELTNVETASIHGNSPEPTNFGPFNGEPITIPPPTIILPEVTPIKVILTKVEPMKNQVIKSEPADASFISNPKGSHKDIKVDDSTATQAPTAQTSKVKLNAWGKPMKADPTRNEEGATVGGSARPLGAENKGRAMLEKMGWSKGTGLGKQKDGILEPISHKVKNTKTGLCSSDEKPSENTPTTTG